MYQALEPIEEQIKTAVLASNVVHFDETGMRVEKSLHWFHVASTAWFTYLFVHKKRGKEALESEASLLKDFQNRAVHDCWEFQAVPTCSVRRSPAPGTDQSDRKRFKVGSKNEGVYP
jgi:hypothetical protein